MSTYETDSSVADDTSHEPPPAVPELQADARYLNRELSRLDFNERVLAIAADDSRPALERAKFLAIFDQNLDEFFQIRVAGLKEQVAGGVPGTSPDGATPQQQLAAIRTRVETLIAQAGLVFRNDVAPRLAAGGVRITDWNDLKKAQRQELAEIFRERIYPVLTPLAVDPAHPFPYISDLSLSLAVVVRDPHSGARRFARVKIPRLLPRFLKVPGGRRFVPLEQVIAAHLDQLFPGSKILAHHVFRVTRDADIEIEVDEADDLLETLESLLRRRQHRPDAVRLEVEATMPIELRKLLLRELQLSRDDLYETGGLLGMGDLWQLVNLDRSALKDTPWQGITPPEFSSPIDREAALFDVVQHQDILVHHPYDRFATTVEAFVREAARDPDVLAIKQTLYRTSDEGEAPIVHSLAQAAEAGKEVVCLVEVTARGDEEANIAWARTLEKAGVHVLYGVVGLKTHAKLVLVVRREGDSIRLYCHIGSGNYNSQTAKVYEDIGLFTANPKLAGEVATLFNHLTGYASHAGGYSNILVAPATLRPRLLELIEAEAHSEGEITIKMNALADGQMIDALYEAAAAGAQIDLIVRSVCCLRPGVPGLSENIRVRSIVGRYLEHSRIFRFGKASRDRRYFIGSADLMQRNLDRRVECVTPISDPTLTARLDEILAVNLEDDILAWELGPDGWQRVETKIGVNTHDRLQELAEIRVYGDR